MKLIHVTKRFKYFKDDNNLQTTHNTGEYDILTCGCYRQPVQKEKKYMALAKCPLHPGKHYHIGILATAPIEGFEYNLDGTVKI